MHQSISDELRARISAALPIGRMGRADEMAAAALFLSSPAASFVYGASFNVDGGSMFE
jgi:3-oxoacyl-[acyl-carrier protein] reductase